MRISFWDILAVLLVIATLAAGILLVSVYNDPGLVPFLHTPTLPQLVVLPTKTNTPFSIVNTWTPTPSNTPTHTPTPTEIPLPHLSITLNGSVQSQGISLARGGDMDTLAENKGNQGVQTHRTGNGSTLTGADGNNIKDYYIQFNIDDQQFLAGAPTARVRIEVDYFDEGADKFSLQYDGSANAFTRAGTIQKDNSLTIKTAVFYLCDAHFANRANGADLRIFDHGDGAEYIHAVRVIALPSSANQIIRVDDFGANPFDDLPDSDAIQMALDSTCSGDTVVFTSGTLTAGYQAYLINKTLFLTGTSAKQNLKFTASVPADHVLLRATSDLKGYVARLYSRSRVHNPGLIDDIDFGFIDIHGGRDVRTCKGPDQVANGAWDNWGSWLPECSISADPWCLPGILGMDGGLDLNDANQDYLGRPDAWTSGIYVHDLTLYEGECGSGLAFFNSGSKVENVMIDTVGDHVHVAGCAYSDDDGDKGGWSDGITLFGPGQSVIRNTIINPSDIGIVFFGGKNTQISENWIEITSGNYGAFGGIAVHPWIFGDISGLEISANQIVNLANSDCGGIHAGINLGPHMWGGACVETSNAAMFGNPLSCSGDPAIQEVAACLGQQCQLWAYVPYHASLTMRDNSVTGAHINYLVEGLALFGDLIDENNLSQTPQLSDWEAARRGCSGETWGSLDKVAHHPKLPGYTDIRVHCER